MTPKRLSLILYNIEGIIHSFPFHVSSAQDKIGTLQMFFEGIHDLPLCYSKTGKNNKALGPYVVTFVEFVLRGFEGIP